MSNKTNRTWRDLKQEVALRMWIIECADQLIQPDDAKERWQRMESAPTGKRVEFERMAGTALIALEDIGLLEYE